jgi:hypothetical protein
MFCNVLEGWGRRLILGNRRACVSPGRWLVRLRCFPWWPNGSGDSLFSYLFLSFLGRSVLRATIMHPNECPQTNHSILDGVAAAVSAAALALVAFCPSPLEPVWTHEMYALLTVHEVRVGYQG